MFTRCAAEDRESTERSVPPGWANEGKDGIAGRWLALYGRGTIDHAFAEEGKDQELNAGELGVEIGPFRHVGAYAGWRWWRFRREQVDDDSKVKLDIEGPVIGLLITF